MDKSKSKCLPGWEQYQSLAERQKAAETEMYNPHTFNPSNQEATLADRTSSKMSQAEKQEHGLEVVEPSVPMYLVAAAAKRKRR